MLKTLITLAVLVIVVAGGFVGWTYLTFGTPLPCEAAAIKNAEAGGEPFSFGDFGVGGNIFLCSYFLVTGEDRLLRDEPRDTRDRRQPRGNNSGGQGNQGGNSTGY